MRLDGEYREFVAEQERERSEADLRQQGAVLADVMKSVFEKAVGAASPAIQQPVQSAASSGVANPVPLHAFPPLPPIAAAGELEALSPAPPSRSRRSTPSPRVASTAAASAVAAPADPESVSVFELKLLAAELKHKVKLEGLSRWSDVEEAILRACVAERDVVKSINEVYNRAGVRMIPRATIDRVRGLLQIIR